MSRESIVLCADGDRGVFSTIQGEGKFTGTPSVFIRTSGCNLRCEWKESDGSTTKCDALYTSFYPESVERSVSDVVMQVLKSPLKNIVITGGEPYLQESVVPLIGVLVEAGRHVTMETNGTVYRETKAQFVSLSPKLSSSREVNGWNVDAVVPASLSQFVARHDVQLKFVVHHLRDLDEILAIQRELAVDADRIWLMPQGIKDEFLKERSRWLSDVCIARGFHLSPRLHLWLWGDERGR